jgi:hypothetical protein
MQNTTFYGRLGAKKATRASQRRFEGDIDRDARALADGADMHVAEIDVPAIWALGIAAAGELGHGAIEAQAVCIGKPPSLLDLGNIAATSSMVRCSGSHQKLFLLHFNRAVVAWL